MITVNQAIKRGNVIVNIPVLVITNGMIGLGLLLWAIGWIPYYLPPVFILSGYLLASMYWSFAITRWRIWAFSSVDDVHELKSRAIAKKLIWPDGYIFEKTEIRTRRDKELLKGLEARFNEPSKPKLVVDDPTIPPVTKVFYSKMTGLILTLTVGSIAVATFGIYVMLNSNHGLSGTWITIIGTFLAITTLRGINNNKPELILDDNGVKIKEDQYLWSEIKNVTITHSSNTWLTLVINNREINTVIDGLEVSGFELQDKINIYQLRFIKSTAANV